ncbi:hypothetical protein BGZ63DRAFT_449059 [Mariannaea sp. PMI_226]|nr:hypothetical protein BGZ63DRAFT_449059 [Mariannaea sp. PMI_226]
MDRSSIDGRRPRKFAVSTPAPASACVSSKKHQVHKELRPASPPLINPWAHQTSSTPVSNEFPALPNTEFPVLEPETSATRSSRTSSASTCPQSAYGVTRAAITTIATVGSIDGDRDKDEIVDGDEDASQPPSTMRSLSNCSDSSRHIFEAAAPRATENLWLRPFGADVVVHTTTMTFRIHRDIVEPESGWFRDHLPPARPDGSPVVVRMPCPGEGVAHCFRFMYTGKTEIFEYREAQPWNIIHLPRCILAYSAAVFLRMSKLAARLLQIVEKTATNLQQLVTSGSHACRDLEYTECIQFSCNYQNALWILHHQSPLALMMPMRLALASVLDGTLFWLVRQPLFLEILRTTWRQVMDAVFFDQREYRRLFGDLNPLAQSPVASEAALQRLFEVENNHHRNEEGVKNGLGNGIHEASVDSRERSESMNYRRSSL